MKSIYTFSFLLLLINYSVFSENFEFDNKTNKNVLQLTKFSNAGVELTYSLSEFSLENIIVNGESMQNIILSGVSLPNDEGAPNIPCSSSFIAIPQSANVQLEIIEITEEFFNNIEIAPAPKIPFQTDEAPLEFIKNKNIYSKNAYYPLKIIKISEVSKIRGVDIVKLGISPFQYNPVSKELKVIKELKIKIHFIDGNGKFGNDRLRSKWWDPILKDMIINSESLPNIDFNKRKTDETGCEYLIICPDDERFTNWADTIKTFRSLQGIQTKVVTISELGGNTVNAIETYIDNAYYDWDIPPVAVLLLGDHGISGNTIVAPLVEHPDSEDCLADNLYADVDGDALPDITIARITARNESELSIMINKFLDYERNPPENPDFYNNPIAISGWEDYSWFQICTEAIVGFLHNELGKDVVRINQVHSGNPNGGYWATVPGTDVLVNYFGPNGLGYIPTDPSGLTWTGGISTDITNAINSGAFITQYDDHGNIESWGCPSYSLNNMSSLSNEFPTYVFSLGCSTGKFDFEPQCFAEAFHRMEHGALGITASTALAYKLVNETYQWGIYDYLWPEFMPDYNTQSEPRNAFPAFASTYGKYFLESSSWPYNTYEKEITYYLFHHHGGAFSVLYTEMPQQITATHEGAIICELNCFTITADEGSFIALSVDGEIIGTGDGTGQPTDIMIIPQDTSSIVDLVITKQNCFRYEEKLPVIQSDEPFVAYKSHEINDSSGNNNTLVDYGEEIFLNIDIKNIGNEIAENVEIEVLTDDDYISITDNYELVGNIEGNQTINLIDAFSFDVADIILDKHIVNLTLKASGSNTTWLSYFTIECHAPVLEYDGFEISDPPPGGNNNSHLEPGETADFLITIKNTGTSNSTEVIGELVCEDSNISINNPSINYGVIAAESSGMQSYNISVDPETPLGYCVDFSFNACDQTGYSTQKDFHIYIGQKDFLVIDLDMNTSSGGSIVESLAAFGLDAAYFTTFPEIGIETYSAIFVCLGVYNNNNVLSSSQGEELANYLNNGGNLYMEGGDTWFYDSQTDVHPMFNIIPLNDGSGNLGTINGVLGSFTEDLSFNYSGENSYIDQITANPPAILILENQSPNYGCGVAYDAETYKTIGVSFEFVGLDDNESTKHELMEKYLEFFELINSGNSTQTIELNQGYQFVSSRIEVEEPDMLIVLQNILTEKLDFVRNSNGETLRKIGPNWINGIGDWITTEGYLFKMNTGDELLFEGVKISAQSPIGLSSGYQFISYLPEIQLNALDAFANILNNNLNFIRNSSGETLRKIGPNWVNGLGDLFPGEGYLVKMFADDELVYNISKNISSKSTPKNPLKHFIFQGGNAADPVYSIYIKGLEIDDEVAVFDGDKMVGASVIISENALENSIPVFSTLTNEKGYETNNLISLRVWDSKTQTEIPVHFSFLNEFPEAYAKPSFPSEDGIYSILKITKAISIGNKNIIGELKIYPNPATEEINIISDNKIESIRIINFFGQNIYEDFVNNNNVNIKTSEYNAGIYFIIIKTEKEILTKKLTIQ
ncbi:MAG: T9SS type A sorting domain-containing protein [Bacteroidales bacterium]|nr:T9SS type A sorting domain-containing protein [Bacteroidales bacterium]